MNRGHINFITHEGFERLENFSGKIEDYRRNKLKSAKDHVNFIRKQFPDKRITALELCSGNSRTLFALERSGILEVGYGVEISKSRFEFAQRWKKEWGFKRVVNIRGNVVNLDFEQLSDFSLCLCVDKAFQFFEPIKRGNALNILRKINKKLKKGGKIILELDGFGRIISKAENGNCKLWEEFPLLDPWRYSLWDCNYETGKKLLALKKIFIKRKELGFSEKSMILQVYKEGDIRSLLKKADFSKVALFADWKGGAFKNDAFSYIVTGTK